MNAQNEPYIDYDYAKFVDTVHYVCELFSSTPSDLGHVKLHKILYFSDMTRFYETGRALTGVEYLKQQYGPTARDLAKALRELENSNQLKVEKRKVFGYSKVEFKDVVPLKSNRLSDEEKELIQAVAQWARTMTAVEISEYSHKLPWESAKLGERIDYATAGQLFPRKVTQADLDWANRAAGKIESGQARARLPDSL
ncbi:MAG: Panacea domain-containing protein [Pseudomonadota bacterium]